MKIYFDVYAIQLTDKNIPLIVEMTAPLGWTLDHLQDSKDVTDEFGYDTILYLKLYREDPTVIATFTDEPYDFSEPNIRLTDKMDPIFGFFHKFEKI